MSFFYLVFFFCLLSSGNQLIFDPTECLHPFPPPPRRTSHQTLVRGPSAALANCALIPKIISPLNPPPRHHQPLIPTVNNRSPVDIPSVVEYLGFLPRHLPPPVPNLLIHLWGPITRPHVPTLSHLHRPSPATVLSCFQATAVLISTCVPRIAPPSHQPPPLLHTSLVGRRPKAGWRG